MSGARGRGYVRYVSAERRKEIARLGGKASKNQIAAGKAGGSKTFQRHGSAHMSEIGKRGARWRQLKHKKKKLIRRFKFFKANTEPGHVIRTMRGLTSVDHIRREFRIARSGDLNSAVSDLTPGFTFEAIRGQFTYKEFIAAYDLDAVTTRILFDLFHANRAWFKDIVPSRFFFYQNSVHMFTDGNVRRLGRTSDNK